MGILDSLRKGKEEQKQKENPTTPPPVGHTLAEILQDKKRAHLFFDLLALKGEEELAERLRTNQLIEGDVDLLAEPREIFSKKIIQTEKIKKLLTKENVISLGRNNEDFAKLIDINSPERTIKAIQSQLENISITDESRFNDIVDLTDAKESYINDGEYKKTEEDVEKLLKEKNITSKEYSDALLIKDPVEKEKALRQLANRTNTGFKRALNVLSFGKFGKDNTLQELQKSETELEKTLKDLDALNEQIGSALFASVNENEDIRNAFSSELVGEKAPNETKVGFKDLRKETLNEEDFFMNWEDMKDNNGYNVAGITPVQQEDIKNKYINNAKEFYRKKHAGKGFLHYLVLTMIEGLIDNRKDELK